MLNAIFICWMRYLFVERDIYLLNVIFICWMLNVTWYWFIECDINLLPGMILLIVIVGVECDKANGIDISVYRPPPAWVWNYRMNFSLFRINNFHYWLIFHIRTFKYAIYIICTACTHFLIAKHSICSQPHRRWSVAICSISFGNSQNDDRLVTDGKYWTFYLIEKTRKALW